jgi:tetratricopeptide (TPR) repeat protein
MSYQETRKGASGIKLRACSAADFFGTIANMIGQQRGRTLLICAALAAMVFAVFGQTAGFDFVNFDDDVYVYNNPVVSHGIGLEGVKWIFAHPACQLYHPLTMLSLMADFQFYGLQAGSYHLTNVVLHAASAILLFLVLRAMTGAMWPSAFVAAIFAIHPLRAESVAWISERKDVLGTFFFMVTLAAYAGYTRHPRSWRRYLMVVGAFLLALLSKPTVVTAPFVFLLLDWWPLRRTESIRRLILEKLPLFAMTAGACVLTVLSASRGIASRTDVGPAARLANAVVSYAVYLRQMIWPENLAVFYPEPPSGQPFSAVVVSFILLAGITAALAFARKRRWLLAGWLWYLGMLVPMIGIVQASAFAHADRMTYLPQIGIGVALAWEISQWGIGRAALGVLAAGIIGLLTVVCFQQVQVWQNSQTLWSYTLACTTNNAVADNNFGLVLLNNGKTSDAIDYFQRAIGLEPAYAEAESNLAGALLKQGDVDDALNHAGLAIQKNPSDAQAHATLANAYFAKGRLGESVSEFGKALELNPSLAMAHNNLGAIYSRQGDDDKALDEFQKALKLRPDLADAHFNLGNVLVKKGNIPEAISHFQRAAQIEPDEPKFKQRLDEVSRSSH